MKNKKIVIFFVLLIALSTGFFFYKQIRQTKVPTPVTEKVQKQKDISKEPPHIVSTKPDPLDENIVSASDIVEITFNRPLENVGEFKSRIEPKIEYKVELSGDRKTARIIPAKPYGLGMTYTLSIGPDSKFDGAGAWGQDKTFHFKTIKYTGV